MKILSRRSVILQQPATAQWAPSRARRNPAQRLFAVLATALVTLLGACATLDPAKLDNFEIVDCELPGPVLRIGASYATTGRAQALRTSADDCAIRGGYYTTNDQANYQTSLRVWLPPADSGDLQAQYFVGQIYEKGLGQAADTSRAADWYRKAADQGHAPAKTALAMLYERGAINGKPDTFQALKLYREAAGIGEGLALASDVSNRDQTIEQLRAQLKQARDSAAQERQTLEQQKDQLRQQIDSLRRQLRQAQASKDQEKTDAVNAALREAENRFAQTQSQQTSNASTLSASESALERLAEKEAAPQSNRDSPRIELIEPRTRLMRGLLTVPMRGNVSKTSIVAKVLANEALANITVNGQPYLADAQGLVKTDIELSGTTTLIEIVAIDVSGRRSALPFVIAKEGAMTQSLLAGESKQGFGRYHALVIGNAAYKDWERLNTPHNDANAVAGLLRDRYGFQVTTLLDASRDQIFRALANLRKTLTENDNLLIYYSGHGSWDNANLQGYWVPVDGARDSISNYISSSDITDQISVMRAKQVLVVADACYSGVFVGNLADKIAADANASGRDWLLDQAQLRSRKVMSSGNIRQVLDGGGGRHSIFAKQFLDALNNKTDAFEATKLYQEIAPRVEKAAEGFGEDQQPQYGQLRFSGHVGGDFVFVPSRG